MRLVFILLTLIINQQIYAQSDTSQAFILYKESLVSSEKASYQESIKKLQKAAEIYTSVKRKRDCQNLIIQNLIRLGNLNEAENLTETLENQISPLVWQKAILQNLKGEIFLNKGRNDLALDNCQKALQTLEKQNNQVVLAEVYTNLGLIYWASGNQNLALDFLQKALDIRQIVFGENHAFVAASYNNLGLIYIQNKPQKAINFYQKALKIYQKKQLKSQIAIAYNNIAVILRQQSNYEEALANLEEVKIIWDNIYGTNHPKIAFNLSNIGQVYFEKEEYDKALNFQKKALEIYIKNYGEKHPEIATVYNLIGSIYLEKGVYNLALSQYQNALISNHKDFSNSDININPNLKNFINSDILLNSFLLKAQAFEEKHVSKTLKINDLKQSLKTLEQADKLLNQIRQYRVKKSDKIALGILSDEIYEDAIRVCLNLAENTTKSRFYREKAFVFAEKSKSAVLLGAIAEAQAKSFAGIPNQLLEKEKQLKSDIAYFEQKLAKDISSQGLRDTLFQLNQKYQQFIKTLEQDYPKYFDLKFNTKISTVESLQSILADKQAILNYFIAEKRQRLYIFLVSKNKFKVFDLPLEKKFSKYLIALRNGIQYQSDATFEKYAYKIYKQLFPQKFEKQFDELIIIPQGKLGTFPFEVLITQKTISSDYSTLPFLIKFTSLSYVYSATLFEQNQQKAKTESDKVLLVAPVSFGQTGLNTLPATQSEVEKIGQIFPQSKILLQDKAQEAEIKLSKLKDYNILHLATHGIVNEANPSLSQIFLRKSQKEDGNLYSGEIFNLNLNADLVTLSACQTGLGKLTKGEGIIGLSRALLYAGANNVIVSLWSVADQSTADLMINFYQNWARSQGNFNQALRQAKLTLIQNKKFAKPYYWGAFILIGN